MLHSGAFGANNQEFGGRVEIEKAIQQCRWTTLPSPFKVWLRFKLFVQNDHQLAIESSKKIGVVKTFFIVSGSVEMSIANKCLS